MGKSELKKIFKEKKITIMGLGLLGRGIGDTKFFAELGADVIVTDLKTEEQLKKSITELKKYKNITYNLGGHSFEDFQNRDLIIKAAGVPLDSPYIKHAKKNKVPIAMDEALFASLAKGVTIVGITGTRGKTTTTEMIFHILKKAGKRVFLAGNIKGVATLPLIYKVRKGDIVVAELSSWQLQGFIDKKVSPQIAVFTNLYEDHLNYYKGSMAKYFADKAGIFLNQKKGDYLIAGSQIKNKIVKRYGEKIQSKVIEPNPTLNVINLNLPGVHNKQNALLAYEACLRLGLSKKEIEKHLATFTGVQGRLQFVKNWKGISIYNDSCGTSPDATIAALSALQENGNKNIILIAGGSDKLSNLDSVAKAIKKNVSFISLISGNGTERLTESLKSIKIDSNNMAVSDDFEKAIRTAFFHAQKGDIILFSPIFASFGKLFVNAYDREEQFLKIVSKILKSK